MAFYRKLPIRIEAVPTADVIEAFRRDTWKALPEWLATAKGNDVLSITASGNISIKTLEGSMLANPDSYILRGVHGELYPCDGKIFAETYQRMEE